MELKGLERQKQRNKELEDKDITLHFIVNGEEVCITDGLRGIHRNKKGAWVWRMLPGYIESRFGFTLGSDEILESHIGRKLFRSKRGLHEREDVHVLVKHGSTIGCEHCKRHLRRVFGNKKVFETEGHKLQVIEDEL